ncbi:NAD(+) diphosphatase [Atopomonas sediminilitoris]|uniref:NAD(+) diphosphatase n=1 Tax=Atopomonas sediminilitoris TaxID=2919919 RepID=UPI001F4DAD12|nr:NAD(+) diphosphatase [Atopomonas sediminilitoris]MCJ8168011.1 NAD(+) diphosphatase [Atopomonas sediminilitoris]
MSWQAELFAPTEPVQWVLVHSQQQFLCDEYGALLPLAFWRSRGIDSLLEAPLGRWRGERVLLIELPEPDPAIGQWQAVRQLMFSAGGDEFALYRYATQIGLWARQHRFCGSCGAPTTLHSYERGAHCAACHLTQYPRLSPSIITLITRGDEVLLGRASRFPPGLYSTLAGFVEPGESLEDCLVREVREEVGVEVTNLRYLASQNWPMPHSLMLGFHAEYAGGEIVLGDDELEDARWFALDQLPHLPPQTTISRYLIDLYLRERGLSVEPVLPG